MVAVRADGFGPGSGYLVGPRLAVCAAHTVGPVGSPVRVFRPGRAPVSGSRVVWRGTPGGRDDAALVAVEDEGWAPVGGGPVRWGRTVTFRPGLECHCCGVPDAVQQDGPGPVQLAQPSGRLNPGDGLTADRYVVAVDGPAPVPRADGRSPWGGLSGAGLLCGPDGALLAGVVTEAPAGWGEGRLAAVPAYVLHADPEFRRVLVKYGGRAGLEPVEWCALAEPAPHGTAGSPAGLLPARRAVVPFRGRSGLLDTLTGWADGGGARVCLVHGPGGSGKTRLAHELGERLARGAGREAAATGWAVVWPVPGAGANLLADLSGAAVPLLVVLDYAETRPTELDALLEVCARHGGGTALRILVLARSAGEWWRRPRQITGAAQDVADNAVVIELPTLEPHAGGRAEAYREAVDAFAGALGSVAGQHAHPWTALAHALPTRDPGGPEFGTALNLHMTALADLLDAADAAKSRPEAAAQGAGLDPEDRIVQHEERYWTATAREQGLLPGLSGQTLADAVAAATVLSPVAAGDGPRLMARVPALADQPLDRRRAVAGWIGAIYPAATADLAWRGLEPDRVAERFLGRHLLWDPAFLDALADGIEPERAERLLAYYARAAAHQVFDGSLDEPLAAACARHSALLGPAAIEVATSIERPAPLLDALDRVAAHPGAGLADLARLADALPQASHVLAGTAVRLTARTVGELRRAARDDPALFLPALAGSLNNLCVRLGQLGLREEALAAVGEAVQVYQELAEARPDAHLPDLAMSLSNLAVGLGGLGRREEALAAINEAVRIRHALARARPEAYLPDLATSLNSLSVELGELGRGEEGLAAIDEAVRIRRALARARPGAHRPDLAADLNNLANRLTQVGAREEGLAAIDEAVAIYRELTEARPDAFRPDLAAGLGNLSVALGRLGRSREALAAADESARIYRDLAHARPEAFLPKLAASLNNLSVDLAQLDRCEEGLAAATESVRIHRALAEARPGTHLADLATSLSNQSIQFGLLDRREEGLTAVNQAVQIYRALARDRPDAYLTDLAASLHNLAADLGELGRRQEALAAITEAVEIRRELARTRPTVYQVVLDQSLHVLALLTASGDEPPDTV